MNSIKTQKMTSRM